MSVEMNNTPSDTAEKAKAQVSAVVSQAKDQAKGALDRSKQAASDLADKARGQIKDSIETQKTTASSAIENVAGAFQSTGSQLRDQGQSGIAEVATVASDQLSRVSNYLRDSDLDQMSHDVEQFARQQPALFLGGAFLLGIVAARFLKSSETPTFVASPGSSVSGTTPRYTAHDYVPGGVAGSGVQPPPDMGTASPFTNGT